MLVRTAQVGCRWAAAAVVAVGVVGAVPAAAVGHGPRQADVDCRHDPSALRTAIDNAPSGATLRVEGTCIGPFTITRDLTLIGIGHAVLDGDYADSTVTVAPASASGVRVRLACLTIIHGVPRGDGTGGGIFNRGTLTLDHSTVKDNSARIGGGIDNLGMVSLTNSVVKDNTANVGGGVDNVLGTVSLTNSAVKDNTAVNGGGFNNGLSGRLTLDRSTVHHNRVTGRGGGIFNDANGSVTLMRSSVHENSASGIPGSAGGGIFNAQDGPVTLEESRVIDNRPDNCAPRGSVLGCRG
ncbi:hypothetical protein ACWGCW_07915 [Streptomyces sp. NPDC054933]